MRALTDSLITFFAKQNCVPATLHWSYATPLVRAVYLKYIAVYTEIIDSKTLFMAYIERSQEEHDFNLADLTVSKDEVTEIKYSLMENRTFWYLAPIGFDLAAYTQKLTLLMSHLSARRTLKFKSFESAFNCQDNEGDIISLDGFFPTVPIIKGELSLLLMKPNFTTIPNLELFDQILGPYGQIVKFEVLPKISVEQFTSLYDSCLTRPYGAAWKDYMQSDPVIACIFASDNLLVTRSKIINLRQQSNVVWIKNIIHCSSSARESKRDLNIFFKGVDITCLNVDLVQLFALNATQIVEVNYSEQTTNIDADLPSNFPAVLRNNAEIVQFMKYIVDQTKKPVKRQRVV
jgi:nucleoside diphosphate kinase